MVILSIGVALILSVVALLHLYWVAGGGVGMQSAAPIVEGKEAHVPPRWLTLIVAVLITSLAVLAWRLAQLDTPREPWITVLGYGVGAVFIVRAIGDFKYVGFFKSVYNSQFASKDTRYFSPLCLLLGVAFLVLTRFGGI